MSATPTSTAPTQEVRPVLRPRSSRVVTLPLSGMESPRDSALAGLALLFFILVCYLLIP